MLSDYAVNRLIAEIENADVIYYNGKLYYHTVADIGSGSILLDEFNPIADDSYCYQRIHSEGIHIDYSDSLPQHARMYFAVKDSLITDYCMQPGKAVLLAKIGYFEK